MVKLIGFGKYLEIRWDKCDHITKSLPIAMTFINLFKSILKQMEKWE